MERFIVFKVNKKFFVPLFLVVLAVNANGALWKKSIPKTEATITNSALSVRVDARTGAYEITQKNPAWTFSGSIGEPLIKLKAGHGGDAIGDYQEISFDWTNDPPPMMASIRVYDKNPIVMFSETCKKAMEMPPAPFPSFTTVPQDLHIFSYQQKNFAPPQFDASKTSTPWLLFDDAANAVIISPASHFMVARMSGDGHTQITSGLNEDLRHLPAGFSQQTILTFGQGINNTWDQWGKSIVALQDVKRPDNNADAVLKYFGYWTDNGAYYYYNYDLSKGYAGTLQSLVAYYREQQIPIRYLQLDSWWYYKSFADPDGKIGKAKSDKLPEGEWNRYGGLLEYKAHPALFPNGLDAFQKSINLPLITHNRWVDPASPYHEHYKISGVAAVDYRWWRDIADYLDTSGIVTYEQDWLDRIYKYSPAFSSTVSTAETFLNDMSRACAHHDITLQYCMPLPCYFLQGSAYKNLTTIRTSDDRFGPSRYNNFLYTSRLAYSMGIWPWSDVFMSGETNNILLATLSAGAVGTGDKMGTEDIGNIFKVARPDGVIVKPDVPALPLDQCYIADAKGTESPLLAATFTDNDGFKTEYVFAFNRSKASVGSFRFTPAELGFDDTVCVYDYFSDRAYRMNPNDIVSGILGGNADSYYIIAPFGRSQIAFLGDKDKFVSTGKQRIASLDDEANNLTVNVLFAPSEKAVTMHGYAERPVKVTAQSGTAKVTKFDTATGYFEIEADPDLWIPAQEINGDMARQMTVTLATD